MPSHLAAGPSAVTATGPVASVAAAPLPAWNPSAPVEADDRGWCGDTRQRRWAMNKVAPVASSRRYGGLMVWSTGERIAAWAGAPGAGQDGWRCSSSPDGSFPDRPDGANAARDASDVRIASTCRS